MLIPSYPKHLQRSRQLKKTVLQSKINENCIYPAPEDPVPQYTVENVQVLLRFSLNHDVLGNHVLGQEVPGPQKISNLTGSTWPAAECPNCPSL